MTLTLLGLGLLLYNVCPYDLRLATIGLHPLQATK